MKQMLFISLVVFLLGACTKNKPPIGCYIGTFTSDNTTNPTSTTVWLKIEASNKDYLLIGATDYNGNVTSVWLDTLYKKPKKHIEGRIPSNGIEPFFIQGKWTHKPFSKNYLIEGTYTQTYYGGSTPYQQTGSFEIRSN